MKVSSFILTLFLSTMCLAGGNDKLKDDRVFASRLILDAISYAVGVYDIAEAHWGGETAKPEQLPSFCLSLGFVSGKLILAESHLRNDPDKKIADEIQSIENIWRKAVRACDDSYADKDDIQLGDVKKLLPELKTYPEKIEDYYNYLASVIRSMD